MTAYSCPACIETAEIVADLQSENSELTRNGFVLSKQLQFAEETLAKVRKRCEAVKDFGNIYAATLARSILAILDERP